MFIFCLFPRLLDFLMYALLNVRLVIVILPCLWSRFRFHIWMLKRVPSPTFSPCAICTAWIQILLSLSHLSHNSLNIIRTKWWSSSPIVSLTFSSCSWTCPLNHSWYLIRKLYYSCLCTMFQWYFHCECTIYSIPTTTPAAQPIAVLSYYLSARYCSYMLRYAPAVWNYDCRRIHVTSYIARTRRGWTCLMRKFCNFPRNLPIRKRTKPLKLPLDICERERACEIP